MPSSQVVYLVGLWFVTCVLIGFFGRNFLHKIGGVASLWNIPLAHSAFLFLAARFVRFPFTPTTYILSLLPLFLVAMVVGRRSLGPLSEPRTYWPPVKQGRVLLRGVSISLLLFSWIINARIWVRGSRGYRVVPNHDAIYHATQISNASRFDSLDPSALYASLAGKDPARHLSPGGIYPLISFYSDAFGVVPSRALYDVAFVFMVVVWPLSLFLLCRALAPQQSLGAGIAAVLSCGVYLVPFGPLSWGGIPMAIGLVAANLALAAFVTSLRHSPAAIGYLFPFLLLSVAAIHTSEVFILLIWGGIATSTLGFNRVGASARMRWTTALLGSGAVVLGAGWSTLEQIVGKGFIRPLGAVSPRWENIVEAVGQSVLLTAMSPVVAVLPPLLLIIILSVNGNEVSGLALGKKLLGATYFLVFAVIGSGRPHLDWLSRAADPWYRQYARIAYLVVTPLVICGALALSSDNGWRLSSKNRLSTARGILSTLVIAALAVGCFASIRATGTRAQQVFQEIGALSESDSKIPERNPELLRQGTRVLATLDTGVGHWWSDYRVWTPAAGYLDQEARESGYGLADSVANYLGDPNVQAQYKNLGIDFVLTNKRSLGGFNRPDFNQIRYSGAFVPIVRGENVTLWRLAAVGIRIHGDLAPWRPSTSKNFDVQPILSSSFQVTFENLAQVTTERKFKMRFEPPSCQPGNRLEEKGLTFTSRIINVTLDPGETITKEFRVIGGSCTSDEGPELTFGFLREVKRLG